MDSSLKTLFVDASTGFYRVKKYNVGRYFGPVDLGLHLSGKHNSLNFGTGLLAGSVFPGSNRMIFTGYSPCWGGFYVSSMGGAGLVFDDLGINLVSLIKKAPVPSILYLNRIHGEEIQVEMFPVDVEKVWSEGRKGIYSLMDYTYELYGDRYPCNPRILSTGPASAQTDIGGIASVPINKGKLTYVDTWAGRGGMGSKMLQEHGIAAVIYGGTFLDEDFRDRKVADKWFEDKYMKKMAAKDFESTTKYRFDPKFDTGGTFGVNYSSVKGGLLAFNYRTIHMTEEERLNIVDDLITNHYLKQFNEETIKTKQQKNCGEPCVAVCKKMKGEFKKDFEPYQALGPLCGIFDQRAAEDINHYADSCGFDAISIGGVISWLMDCMHDKLLSPEELNVSKMPVFDHVGFDVVKDSRNNADLGIELLQNIIKKDGLLNMYDGARAMGRRLSASRSDKIMDKLVCTGYARKGWMVPNQYWTAGVLSPMAIMGKYYMDYGKDFIPPRELGIRNADRLVKELILDNTGICRFHRGWAEEMMPEIIDRLFGKKEEFITSLKKTASRINGRNSSVFWESELNKDYIHTFLKRQKEIEKNNDPELEEWIKRFDADKESAASDFWYEIYKGINETLRDF